jgi:hypothetical protein
MSEKPLLPTTCRMCQGIHQRRHTKTYADGSKYYVDEGGKKWLGRVCPNCVPKLKKGYYEPRAHAESICKQCSKAYIQKTSNQAYCSKVCADKAHVKPQKVIKLSGLAED